MSGLVCGRSVRRMVNKKTEIFAALSVLIIGALLAYSSLSFDDVYFSMWALTNILLAGIWVNTIRGGSRG